MNGFARSRVYAARGHRLGFILLTLCALFGTSTGAQAQKCVPDCREGYVCVRGKCVSACNPPCPDGERCTSEGRCAAATAPSQQPAVATATSVAGSYVAPPDKALVVFVREKGARQDHVTVFGEEPRFLTVIEKPQRHVKAIVNPGKHTFYFGDIVRAELAAGRTYIIKIRAERGFWGWRVAGEPALRDTGAFVASSRWIRDTKLDMPNLKKRSGQWEKDVNAKRMRKAVAASEAAWLEGSDDWRAARTISAKDGRTAAEAGKL